MSAFSENRLIFLNDEGSETMALLPSPISNNIIVGSAPYCNVRLQIDEMLDEHFIIYQNDEGRVRIHFFHYCDVFLLFLQLFSLSFL